MRKNASQNASTKYPELQKRPGSPYWIFQKYSKEKKAQFRKSTGITASENLAYKAYVEGKKEFDKWLGTALHGGKTVLMRDILNVVLASKEFSKNGKRGPVYRSAHNQIVNHLIPSFGHFRPDQITSRRWKDYDQAERVRIRYTPKGKPYKRTALANTRKYLIEALRRAEEDGIIAKVPKLKNFDPKSKPPKYLDKKTIISILKLQYQRTKLLFFIMWKQGPRPEEALQYEWSMIDWNRGKYGYLKIPGHITKTGRYREIPLQKRVGKILKWLHKNRQDNSPFIFPSRYIPGDRQRNYRKGWEAACKKLNIDADPYNLRDTFITNRLKKGDSPTFIGKYCDTSASQIESKYAVAEQEALEGIAE